MTQIVQAQPTLQLDYRVLTKTHPYHEIPTDSRQNIKKFRYNHRTIKHRPKTICLGNKDFLDAEFNNLDTTFRQIPAYRRIIQYDTSEPKFQRRFDLIARHVGNTNAPFYKWFDTIHKTLIRGYKGILHVYKLYLHAELSELDKTKLDECQGMANSGHQEQTDKLICYSYKYPHIYLAVVHNGFSGTYVPFFYQHYNCWWQKVIWWIEVTPAPEGLRRCMALPEIKQRVYTHNVESQKISEQNLKCYAIFVITWPYSNTKLQISFRRRFLYLWMQNYKDGLNLDGETTHRLMSFHTVDVFFKYLLNPRQNYTDQQLPPSSELFREITEDTLNQMWQEKDNLNLRITPTAYFPRECAFYDEQTIDHYSMRRMLISAMTRFGDIITEHPPYNYFHNEQEDTHWFLNHHAPYLVPIFYQWITYGRAWPEWKMMAMNSQELKKYMREHIMNIRNGFRRPAKPSMYLRGLNQFEPTRDMFQYWNLPSWWNLENRWDTAWPDYTPQEANKLAIVNNHPETESGISGPIPWIDKLLRRGTRNYHLFRGRKHRVARIHGTRPFRVRNRYYRTLNEALPNLNDITRP